jgi:protein-disulfide isomerase
MKESTVGLTFRSKRPSLSHGCRRGSIVRCLALALLLPLGLACTGGREDAQAPVADPGVRAEPAQLPDPTAPTPGGAPRLSPQEQAQQPPRLSEMGYNEGSPEAPVKVLELSDFGCGYCRRFHEETYPRLREIYIDAGLVEWKYIPFVLGKFPNGLQAATAAECAGEQQAFFPMADRLFAEQGAWKSMADPYPYFSGLTADLGIDADRFDRCIEGGWRESRIWANVRLGQQLGARGTPTFIVDGQLVQGALPLEDFRDVIDVALRRKGVTPPSR